MRPTIFFGIVVGAAVIVVVLVGCLFIRHRGGLHVCSNCKQAAVFTPLGFSNVGRHKEAAAPAAATPRTQPGSLGDDPAALWGCAHCTYLNAQRVQQCAECGAEKPAASPAGGGAQATDVEASPDFQNGLATDFETPSEEVLQRVSELFAQQEQRVAQLTPRRASTSVIDWVWVIDRWVLVV